MGCASSSHKMGDLGDKRSHVVTVMVRGGNKKGGGGGGVVGRRRE